MADAVLEIVKQQMKQAIPVSTHTISEVTNKLQELMDEVRFVNASLHDATGVLQAEQLREMDVERQLKEVVYEVEDTIESSSVQMAAAEAANKFFRLLLISKLGQALERAIDSIRSRRLDPITRRIQAYRDLGIQQPRLLETNQVQSEQLNKEVPPPPPNYFVGLEDEAKTLISSLMEATERLDVIAITGMPGIGKTALASTIFHDSRISDEFPTRIWVADFITKEMCLSILKQCMNPSTDILNDFSEMNDDELKDKVRYYLKKSKYLLVVDDVWDAEFLNSVVANMLPETGKVLITSCNNRITKKPHVLRFLNEKESWELLQLEVFGVLDDCPETLESTGKCIAGNCDGLPLSISVVGNSLAVASSTPAAKKLTEKWWEAVSEDVTTYVTDYGSQHHVLERVEASYIKLPQRLQECFLYLGVFPEGHEIRVRTLIRLWIGEGLLSNRLMLILEKSAAQILGEIEEGELQNLEETGEKYLCDLIDRNLVMVVKSYGNGHIKTCRLHKLIYSFCRQKAVEQDFYQGLNLTGDGPISLSPNCRRLCVYSHLSEFLSRTRKGQRVRSVLCFMDRDEDKVEDSYGILECFKLLRVLDCSHAKFTRFPKSLSKLIHLRYISLSCDEIRTIPKAVSSLRYLETLVVHTESASVQLEANIWSMFKLRHLVTKAAIVLATRGEGKGEAGKNLRTLTRFAPVCCTEDVFTRAPNLKTLGIRGHLAALAEPESLKVLERLEKLKMINESAADCRLHLECFPPTLKRLTLSGTYLKWECMSTLGKIDTLEILKLKNNALVGESWTSTDADGFGKLGFLLIGETDLVSWEASDDCFPSLKCLVLDNCGRLRKVPSALARSLEKLDVGRVSESVVDSAIEIQQEIAMRR